MLFAVRSLVLGHNVLCGLAPYQALSLTKRRSEPVFFIVGNSENRISHQANAENNSQICLGDWGRVHAEILRLDGVRRGQKAETAPGEIEAVVVVGNVDGAQVPRLVDEEVSHIQDLEDGDKYQRRLDVAQSLILVGHV